MCERDVSFAMIFFSMKRDCEIIFRFVSILFLCDFNVIIFSMNEDQRYVCGYG